MKIIELTKKHHNKLLEMCSVLFPDSEWEMSDQRGNCGMHSQDYNKIFVYEGTKPYSFPKSLTHWFEFCMTHLASKIERGHDYFSNLYLNVLNSKQHPVDYLYEKFKKYNNENSLSSFNADSTK